MAQVIWQKLGGDGWTAHSAGSNPSGYVHPLALVALNEIGLPNEGLTSKHMEQFYEQKMDQVVTCLLYTSPSPRDQRGSRMPSSA